MTVHAFNTKKNHATRSVSDAKPMSSCVKLPTSSGGIHGAVHHFMGGCVCACARFCVVLIVFWSGYP